MNNLIDLIRIKAQTRFFRKNLGGCAFAAFAARNPRKYGWVHRVIDIDTSEIDGAIEEAIGTAACSTLSIIFRRCETVPRLTELTKRLLQSRHLFLGQNVIYEGHRCLGYRLRLGSNESWVSGFGPFHFLPKTRQSPHTEIIMRVKPRPAYEKVMKKAPDGVVHLADMDMLGLPDPDFKRLWSASFDRTAELIGHKPDLRSAAKTTFAIPIETVE
jgi:hypothetical protein